MDRSTLEKAIVQAVESLPVPLCLYGSFGNRTFHFDPDTASSFSDVDLVASEGEEQPVARFGPVLWHRVAATTGLRLRMSLRSRRLHSRQLGPEQSYVVAVIEEGCKLETACGRREALYHAFKFIWRTACWPVCYDAPFRLADYGSLGIRESLARTLLDVKLGTLHPSPSLLLEVVRHLQGVAPRTAADVLRLLHRERRRQLLNEVQPRARRVLAEHRELLADCGQKLQGRDPAAIPGTAVP